MVVVVVGEEKAHTVHSKASLFSFMIFEMLFITPARKRAG